MTRALRFGIVGLDHWYSAIPLARSLASDERFELVSIAHSDVDRAQAVAADVGSPRVTNNVDELIDDVNIDVIASFVSVDQNPQVCIAAANAGKHIMSTKPLARTLAEADDVVSAVQNAGVVFIPGESRARESELSQLLAGWVQSGLLGTITSGSFTLSGSLPESWSGADDAGWWVDPAKTPGGGWVDHSIYQLDRMRWLLGEEVAGVSGRVGNHIHHDLEVEDYGHAIVTFSGGATFAMEDTWTAPAQGSRTSMSLVGTAGAVSLDSATGLISLSDRSGPLAGWVHAKAPSDGAAGIESMLAAVSDPSQAIATVVDGWNNLAACLAFYESAASSGSSFEPAHLPRDR
ncbi:MAG: Gfo/Idh/MocA family oxidoreductase [Pseudolysinimonas sp.]